MVCLSCDHGGLSPVNVNWNGKLLNLNCYRFDQNGKWNEGNQVCGKSKLFLSRSFGGVLFFYLSQPTTEHFANFIQRYREQFVFFGIKRASVPEDMKENFQGVELTYGSAQINNLVLFFHKTRTSYHFYQLNKQRINLRSECVAVRFGNNMKNTVPKNIYRAGFLQYRH